MLQFVGPALQGASFIGRVAVPVVQQALIGAGLTGAGMAINAANNKSKPKPTGRQKLTRAWGTIPDDLFSREGGGFAFRTSGGVKGVQPSYRDAQGNVYDAVSGRLLFPARKPSQQLTQTTFDIPAGTVQPGAITRGVTSSGEIDRSQSDEYKSQMAQYQNLINQKKTQQAEDLGMQIWMQKYGKSPMAQAGGAIGAYNPLLASMFPETKGFAAAAAPQQEDIQMGDLGTRAQGETGYTMESLNPLQAQAQQQAATAAQADKATTAGVKIPVRNRVQAFLYGGM